MPAMALVFFLAAVTPKTPAPYVTVYHDDAVSFQVRRDRIKRRGPDTYMVWIRWLWAEPRPWKGDQEAARVVIADVDCKHRQVRELGVEHKNAAGKVFDAEDIAPENQSWKSFDRGSGAYAAVGRLCEFLPQMVAPK